MLEGRFCVLCGSLNLFVLRVTELVGIVLSQMLPILIVLSSLTSSVIIFKIQQHMRYEFHITYIDYHRFEMIIFKNSSNTLMEKNLEEVDDSSLPFMQLNKFDYGVLLPPQALVLLLSLLPLFLKLHNFYILIILAPLAPLFFLT